MGETYDELEIGKKYLSSPVTLTMAHTLLLGSLINNWHPSHINHDYASRGPFGKVVMHGELTHSLSVGGFSSILFDTSLGQLGGSYRLTAPVFEGDTLYTEMVVKEKRPSKKRPGGIVIFGMTAYKQDGTVVSEGEATFLVGNEHMQVYPSQTPAGQNGS